MEMKTRRRGMVSLAASISRAVMRSAYCTWTTPVIPML